MTTQHLSVQSLHRGTAAPQPAESGPTETRYRLHRRLPKSKLIIVEAAGHSESEPGTTKALVQAVAEFD